MGKLLLLLATALGLGTMMLSIQGGRTVEQTLGDARSGDAALLARELAHNGTSMAVNASIHPAGFRNSLGFGVIEHGGGWLAIGYEPSDDRTQATFTVTSHHNGQPGSQVAHAVHRSVSTYNFVIPDFPSPVWVDTPYLTSAIDEDATFEGGDKSLILDRTQFDRLRLGTLLDAGHMQRSLQDQVQDARGSRPGAMLYDGLSGLLAETRTPPITEIHARGVSALDLSNGHDAHYAGGLTLGSNLDHGTADVPAIVRVQGDLVLDARLRGHGLLIVEGELDVQSGGRLVWNGLVLVRSTANRLPVTLEGPTTIRGALLIDHEGAPPGGHMDVTVWRDPRSSQPQGSEVISRWRSHPAGPIPFYDHHHKYDETTGSRNVTFVAPGRPSTEGLVHLRTELDALGSEDVYLELVRTGMHGLAALEMEVSGEPALSGYVQSGFGDLARDSQPYVTRPFAANTLERLEVNVQSLRLLQQLFDDDAVCAISRVLCVGRDWNRSGALTLRLRRESTDAVVWESALYWHGNAAEAAADAAEELAWRARILAGEEFGTHLDIGDQTEIRFAMNPITHIGTRLDFAVPEVNHAGTWNEHWDADDPERPALPTEGARTGKAFVCHSGSTQEVSVSSIDNHLRHGDELGRCSDTGQYDGHRYDDGSGGSDDNSGSFWDRLREWWTFG